MGRGILSGLFWGSLISIFVLSAVSLLAPPPHRAAMLPEAQTASVADPAGDAGEAGTETDAASGEPVAGTSPETAPDAAMETEPTPEGIATDGSAPDAADGTTDAAVADTDTDTGTAVPQPEPPDAGDVPETAMPETAMPDTDTDTDTATDMGESATPDADASDTGAADGASTESGARPGTEVAASVSVPAGSEFRRPPPETEAALPTPDATAPETARPEVPLGGPDESTLAMPDTMAAARPETPGMEVTAPETPGFGDAVPEIASVPPTEPGLRAPTGPSGPGAPSASADLAESGARSFPPPVTAEAVGSETLPPAADGGETIVAGAEAERLESGNPDETLAPGESARAEETRAMEIAALDAGTAETARPAEALPVTAVTVAEAPAETAVTEAAAAAAVAARSAGETLTSGESAAADAAEAMEIAALDAAAADTPLPDQAPAVTAAAVADAPVEAALAGQRSAGMQPVDPQPAEVAVRGTGPDGADTVVADAPRSVASDALASVAGDPAAAALAPQEAARVEAAAAAGPDAAERAAAADEGATPAGAVPVAEVPETVGQPPLAAEPAEGLDAVAAEQSGPVDGAEGAATADGERLASADLPASLPESVDPDRVAAEVDADPAELQDRTEPLPATPAAPAPAAETDLDRPERKEVTIARPGETPPAVGDSAPAGPGVRVMPLTDRANRGSRLPQIGIGDPAEDGDEVAVATDPPEGALPDDPVLPGGAPRLDALSRNAAPFSNPEGKPLFSVILIDDGSRTLDREVLSTFSFPVTFAVDPTMPDAAVAAAFYRDNGFEVVVLATGLPANAQPRDLEVALEAELATVPQAVAIMDPAEDGFGSRRALVEHVVSIAADAGHGLIGWDRGLGSVRAAAEREGQPAALVFRSLDGQGERNTVIRRYLDRAAFKAVQEGAVVMAGHAQPETVTALFEWAASDKASEMALAPVSAVLRAR